jgi:hypothetical protein
MRRRTLLIASMLGLICCLASGLLFVLTPDELSILWLAALLILLSGLVASLVACLIASRRYKSRLMQVLPAQLAHQGRRVPLLRLFGRQMYIHVVPVDTLEGRRWRLQSIKRLVGPLLVFFVLVGWVELLMPIAQRYVASPRFGVFVALTMLIFPLLSLLYGLFSRDVPLPSSEEGDLH